MIYLKQEINPLQLQIYHIMNALVMKTCNKCFCYESVF